MSAATNVLAPLVSVAASAARMLLADSVDEAATAKFTTAAVCSRWRPPALDTSVMLMMLTALLAIPAVDAIAFLKAVWAAGLIIWLAETPCSVAEKAATASVEGGEPEGELCGGDGGSGCGGGGGGGC